MVTVTFSTPSADEEWLDSDFDLLEGEPIHASDVDSDKEGDEDWDVEMDLGKTGGATVKAGLAGTFSKGVTPRTGQISRMHTIRPPLQASLEVEEEDDESVPTIKAIVLPNMTAQPAPPSAASSSAADMDDDFEDGFALPSDLTRLSLRPLDLNHRSSKSSMEWGDKDHTTSSQSSDAYSTFGFADRSPPSTCTSASSVSSLPDTEEEDEDASDDLLDGLVVPSGLFESGQSGKKLTKILESKKKTVRISMRVKVVNPDPEDDFESGLVLDDETELSPGRLLQTTQTSSKKIAAPSAIRSKSVPPASARCPPARLDKETSSNNPPVSSVSQFRKINAPPPPPRPTSASKNQTYSQALTSSLAPSSFNSLTNKSTGLRGQKSHTGLKPMSPPPVRQLTRKASMPSLSDHAQDQLPGSSASSATASRYIAPTASSRAKTHASTTSRMHGLDVAPTRPTTPSSNPVALRLTMPTASSRLKARAPISGVFSQHTPTSARSASPLPFSPRPSSSSSEKPPVVPSKVRHAQSQSLSGVPTTKVLKRPKRQQTYGDGTELDAFEDLPLDRDKEGKYHVQPKGYGNRVPGASYPMQPKVDYQPEQGSLRRTPTTESLGPGAKVMPSKTLKRTSRMEFSASKTTDPELLSKKKKTPTTPTNQSKRKPTLIRNLGGAGCPRVVGEMQWNPQTLRWEGNDQVLREFDATVGTSTRPALITHLTGSSLGSPVNSLAAGARKVGNMIFDPSRMCWVSMLPPEEEEPDVFANMADDEDSDDWEVKGDTVRGSLQLGNKDAAPTAPQTSGSITSRVRSKSESESDRGSRASMICDVEDGFLEMCQAAEQRHRREMRGWTATTKSAQPDRAFLYEIRALATRQY